MRGRLWQRGRSSDLERRLRRERPRPSDTFVHALAERVRPRSTSGVRSRTRLGVAAALTAVLAAVLGATGGFSAAATSIAGATRSVTHFGSTPPKAPTSPVQGLVDYSFGATHALSSACDEYGQAPLVTSVDPSAVAPGQALTVSGAYFTGESAVSGVTVRDSNGDTTDAAFTATSSTSLTVVIASTVHAGPATLTVQNCDGSDSGTFSVETDPQIASASPTSGGSGDSVTLTPVTTPGGFLGVTSVSVNGKAADYDAASDGSSLTLTVPVGARAGDGQIDVTNGVATEGIAFTVLSGAPTVTRFTPDAAQVGDGPIVVSGGNFEDSTGSIVTSVTFAVSSGSPASASFTVTAKNRLEVTTVPSGAVTGPITVHTTQGTAVSGQDFTVVSATPVIDSLSPDYGKPTANVAILGSSLTGIDTVDFTASSGTTAATFRVKNDGEIDAKVPSDAVTGPVTVSRRSGTQSATSGTFTVVSDAPQLDHVAPTRGGFGTAVTIYPASGTSLLGTTQVQFNGKPDPTFTVNNDGTISATVPAGAAVRPPGVGVITVGNATGSATLPFDVLGSGPSIKSVIGTLDNGAAAEIGDPITITGANLDTVTRVRFGGGKSSTSFLWQDPNLLTVRVPSGATTGDVTVVNPDGEATSTVALQILAAPTINGFDPAFGRGGAKVTIVGTNLSGATAVYIGGSPAKFNVVSDTEIDAVVAKNASSGPVEVIVGRRLEGDSGNNWFQIVHSKPTVKDDFSPTSGAAGTDVTINGTNFVGPMTVKFGASSAGYVRVVSDTQLIAEIPSGAFGTVPITVGNLAGAARTKAKFGIIAVRRIQPRRLRLGRRTTIRVYGTNLTLNGVPTLTVGGVPVTLKRATPGVITATVTPAAAGLDRVVVGSGGTQLVVPLGLSVHR